MIQALIIIGVLAFGAVSIYAGRSATTKIVSFIVAVLLFLFLLI